MAADRRTGEVSFLFAETQSRIIVTVQETHLQSLLKAAKVKKVPAKRLGKVTGKSIKINDLIFISVNELEMSWETGFERSVLGSCVG